MLLLGGDHGHVPVPLGAFPQVLRCDGGVNVLFAPSFPPLLLQQQYLGNVGLLAGVILVFLAKLTYLGWRMYYQFRLVFNNPLMLTSIKLAANACEHPIVPFPLLHKYK